MAEKRGEERPQEHDEHGHAEVRDGRAVERDRADLDVERRDE